jgi:MoCo/4Fe-4S cofactor protein with predicted Tat translocation signal
MNHLPNLSPAPVTGRRYWRSLDELADTPEFKDWLHREFPQGASEFERSGFPAALSSKSCRRRLRWRAWGCWRRAAAGRRRNSNRFRQAAGKLRLRQPQYFATAMPTRTGAVPLVVKSYDGRPIKIEGNTLYPGGNGGTDRYAQASILNLYDPDRAQRFQAAAAKRFPGMTR